jgi:hypothetical protein
MTGDSQARDVLSAGLRARRATGAVFFSVFGAAWILVGCYRAQTGAMGTGLAIGAAVAMIIFCYSHYRRERGTPGSAASSPMERKVEQWFHLINGGQWVLILVLGKVLVNLGYPDWVLPLAILIIGAHFLPLAYLFRNRMNYITGAALISLALLYPRWAPGGPQDPLGCFGAGAILWASALWNITRAERR